jgi:redox-sensing transcriptional repressor
MEGRGKVSEAVVRRLPGYHRHLQELEGEGVTRISSQELSQRMGLTASQIRQDINCFGALGQQGYGYNVSELRRRIGDILGLDRGYRVIVVGAGNIGRAVASYAGFARMRFVVDALFDTAPELIGKQFGTVAVHPADNLSAYLAGHKVDIAVIATPAIAARATAAALVEGGVRALWNFTPVDIPTKAGYTVQNMQLTDNLLLLTYHMKNDL